MDMFCRFQTPAEFRAAAAAPAAGPRLVSGAIEFVVHPTTEIEVVSDDPTMVADFLAPNVLDAAALLPKDEYAPLSLKRVDFPDGEFHLALDAEIDALAETLFRDEPRGKELFGKLARAVREIDSVSVIVTDAFTVPNETGPDRPRRVGVAALKLDTHHKSLASLAYIFGVETIARSLADR